MVFSDHSASVTLLRRRLRDAPGAAPALDPAALLEALRLTVADLQGPQGASGQVARAQLLEATPALQTRYERLVDDYADAALDELLGALRARGRPDDTTLVEAHLLTGAVFALRGARRAAGRSAAPDPQALIARAFDLVGRGVRARPPQGQ